MSRNPNLASTAVSLPEEQSSSVSPDPSTPSTSKKQPSSKKVKSGARKVSNLTEAQLEKKRANDKEAQRNIRQRTKDTIKGLETKLDAEIAKVAEREARIRQLEHENADLHEEMQSRATRDAESRAISHDLRRPSVISETGSWQQPQQAIRRPSHAESIETRNPSMASSTAEMAHARSQTFPAPPPSYLNRNAQAFAQQQILVPQPSPAPTSPSGYGLSQHIKLEQGGPYQPRILTQPDPLRFPARSSEMVQQDLTEGAPVHSGESRSIHDHHGPSPGQQYQYTQILRSSSHDQHFQQSELQGHYSPYHAHAAYSLPPPPAAGQHYAHPGPQYGPIEPYPHGVSTTPAAQAGYPPAQGPPPRPHYEYYQSNYPQPPT